MHLFFDFIVTYPEAPLLQGDAEGLGRFIVVEVQGNAKVPNTPPQPKFDAGRNVLPQRVWDASMLLLRTRANTTSRPCCTRGCLTGILRPFAIQPSTTSCLGHQLIVVVHGVASRVSTSVRKPTVHNLCPRLPSPVLSSLSLEYSILRLASCSGLR